jgi:NAD(P)-dependent dehydrogenase (short-subunit alcohol dehydrogenase family)
MENTSEYRPPDLTGRVALVAGATRGVGRGIALALGEAGATVYCQQIASLARRTKKSRLSTMRAAPKRSTKPPPWLPRAVARASPSSSTTPTRPR